MIEMLNIIASLSITLALFYTFYKVGRQSAYDDLLKHFKDAAKVLGKQDTIIQAYNQKLEETEKEGGNTYDFNREDNIDWEQRRYEIAKEAVNGLLAAPIIEGIDPNPPMDDIARNAVKIADYLIEELKKEKGGGK